MAPDKSKIVKFGYFKPDTSKPLVKRSNWLTVPEAPEQILVVVDLIEEIEDSEQRIDPKTGQIKKLVRFHCREIVLKQDIDKSGKEDTIFEYFPQQEVLIKDSNSTDSWYKLADYKKASHWPKEGIWFWVWKNPAPEGIRWQEVE